MPDIDIRSLSVCIQALQDAIRHYEFLCQSETVDADDYEEAKYMYELELARLTEVYAAEEKLGRTSIPLAALLKVGSSQST
jgi:hypothetical protein